jgi:hypothetical protein
MEGEMAVGRIFVGMADDHRKPEQKASMKDEQSSL